MSARILLVDGDPDLCLVLSLALGARGYRVEGVATAGAALATARSAPPDLVILELWLGERGAGMRLLKRLRAEPATAELPVMVWSTDVPALRAHEVELRARGCAVVEKPFTLGDLIVQVGRLAPIH